MQKDDTKGTYAYMYAVTSFKRNVWKARVVDKSNLVLRVTGLKHVRYLRDFKHRPVDFYPTSGVVYSSNNYVIFEVQSFGTFSRIFQLKVFRKKESLIAWQISKIFLLDFKTLDVLLVMNRWWMHQFNTKINMMMEYWCSFLTYIENRSNNN